MDNGIRLKPYARKATRIEERIRRQMQILVYVDSDGQAATSGKEAMAKDARDRTAASGMANRAEQTGVVNSDR